MRSCSFDRFSLAVANDNYYTWSYGLDVITEDGSYVTPDASFVTLTKDTNRP